MWYVPFGFRLSNDVSPMGAQVINESLPIFLDSAVSIHRLGLRIISSEVP